MFRVLITGDIHPKGIKNLEQEIDIEIQFSPDLPYEEVLRIIRPYHCILSRSETRITRELIEAAPELKVIARAGVGVGNIDVEYATERGILVINTPGKNTNSAAELTMGLLLSAFRKIIPAHQNMQSLNWERHRFNGGELLNKCLGVIGLGNVGHRVARYANAFEMKVQAFDPYLSDEIFERHGVQKVDWITLLSTSDVITPHVPLNSETRGMISKKEIERMKSGVILLNTARGGVIHEKSLLNALESGHVAAAGIDTWEVEPPGENPFSKLPQVVMSPHIGASTTEAQIRIADSKCSGRSAPSATKSSSASSARSSTTAIRSVCVSSACSSCSTSRVKINADTTTTTKTSTTDTTATMAVRCPAAACSVVCSSSALEAAPLARFATRSASSP